MSVAHSAAGYATDHFVKLGKDLILDAAKVLIEGMLGVDHREKDVYGSLTKTVVAREA